MVAKGHLVLDNITRKKRTMESPINNGTATTEPTAALASGALNAFYC